MPGRTHELVMQAYEPGYLPGPVHRVLRALPRRHAHAGQGAARGRVRGVGRADDHAARTARRERELPSRARRCSCSQCALCHQVNGLDPDSEGALRRTPRRPIPTTASAVTSPMASGNAPNLTHLMMRDNFAGGLLDLYVGGPTAVQDSGRSRRSRRARRTRTTSSAGCATPRTSSRWTRTNNQGMPNLQPQREPDRPARRLPGDAQVMPRATGRHQTLVRTKDHRTMTSISRALTAGSSPAGGEPARGRPTHWACSPDPRRPPAGSRGSPPSITRRSASCTASRAVLLPARGRVRGTADPPPAGRPRQRPALGRPVQPGLHHARRHHGVPGGHAARRGLRELPAAAADRRP